MRPSAPRQPSPLLITPTGVALTSAPGTTRTCARTRVSRAVAMFTALALGGVSTGCLSHEYQVSRTELSRLAQLPPEARGQQVAVVQKLGNRRAPAIDPNAPGPPPGSYPQSYPDERAHDGGHVHGGVFVGIGGPSYRGGRGRGYASGGGYSRGGRGAGGVAVAQPVGAAAGAQPSMAQPAGALSAAAGQPAVAPPAGALTAVSGQAAPAAPATMGQTGGALSTAAGAPAVAQPAAAGAAAPVSTGGAGKPGSKDDLAVMAAIAIALAALAVVGLAFTEGARFDGEAAVSPQQLVYLQSAGTERAVPLSLLSEADLGGVEHGLIRDDEGFGIYQLKRGPLNRKGVAFKVDFGFMAARDANLMDGFSSHIGFGYFFHHRAGLLAGATFGGYDDSQGNYQPRHAATLEGQFFPLSWRRFHLGIAGHVGSGLSGSGLSDQLSYGGAALMEIGITTRLAFTLRGDMSSYGLKGGERSTGNSLSLGLAVY